MWGRDEQTRQAAKEKRVVQTENGSRNTREKRIEGGQKKDRDRARYASLSWEQRQRVLQERRERHLWQHQQVSVELRIDDENVVQMMSSLLT